VHTKEDYLIGSGDYKDLRGLQPLGEQENHLAKILGKIFRRYVEESDS
jgi:hypothetical protein